MSKLRFNGDNGRKPTTEARRYIYRVLAASLEEDMKDYQGWILGGIDQEPDRRRLHIVAKKVVAELLRKGNK